jgi:hypothetical protein
MIVQYWDGVSPVGSSAPAFVDVPTPPAGFFISILSREVYIETKNGRSNISRKMLMVDRYDMDVDGSDRDATDPLTEFTLYICGNKNKHVDKFREYRPYNRVDGLLSLEGKGVRVYLDSKDRNSDFQAIQVGIAYQSSEDLR